MLIRLSKNAYVRQYGPFAYILNRISDYDQMFVNAEGFLKWITRVPIDKELLINRICDLHCDAAREVVTHDFEEFIAPLVAENVLVVGETKEDLDKSDRSFSYDVDNPKTMCTRYIKHEDIPHSVVPQRILNEYFIEHPTIFDLQIDITQACTERCVHCYIPEYNPIFLPYEQIVNVLDQFAEQGGVCLAISGGECMLHPDFEKILRYARSKDLIVGVLSNLTLCDEEKIKVLQEVEASVQVSLYSMNPRTHDAITSREGSWVKTKTAIERIRAAQIPCHISCPTMKLNYKDYLDVLAFAQSLKMDAQTDFVIMGKMNCDTSNLRWRLDLPETRKVLEDVIFRSVPINNEYFDPAKKAHMLSDDEWGKRKVCGACVNSVCLDPDGHYYPCAAFGGVNLGSCYEHDLNWIWTKSPETLRIRAVTGKDFPKCLHCKDRNYCSVCMCRNYNETGDMFKPAEHFCKVAAINHEVVDEKQRQMIEAAKGKNAV